MGFTPSGRRMYSRSSGSQYSSVHKGCVVIAAKRFQTHPNPPEGRELEMLLQVVHTGELWQKMIAHVFFLLSVV